MEEFASNISNGLNEEGHSPVPSAETDTLQTSEKATEREEEPAEIVDVHRSLHIDVHVAIGGGEETTEASKFMGLPQDHADTTADADDHAHVDVRADLLPVQPVESPDCFDLHDDEINE